MNRRSINIFFIVLLILFPLLSKFSFAQINGSLYLSEKNYQAQMFNPSFMRTDGATIIAFPFFGGGTLGNSANFKLSDLIRIEETGNPVLDFEHFYQTGNINNRINQWATLPLFYAARPWNEGMLSFYIKEQIQTSLEFNIDAFEFLLNGNTSPEFSTVNTQDMSSFSMGYKEIAFGYTKNLNEKIRLGGRFKFLFGGALIEMNDWNYGINTSEIGDVVTLTSSGEGRLVLPATLRLDEENRIQGINSEKSFRRYFTSFRNPGIAMDMGVTFNPDNQHSFTISALDFGAILFRKNAHEMTQNESYDFDGFDISHSLDAHVRNGYVSSLDIMLDTKEEIRNVYRPRANSKRFMQTVSPKTILSYQYKASQRLYFGLSNQTFFSKNRIVNITSAASKQRIQNISIFESINYFGAKDISIGAGVQWESKHTQLFLSTDNILALYHPAANKSYSISFGISLLLNHTPEKLDKPVSKGSTSKYLPFFRNRN